MLRFAQPGTGMGWPVTRPTRVIPSPRASMPPLARISAICSVCCRSVSRRRIGRGFQGFLPSAHWYSVASTSPGKRGGTPPSAPETAARMLTAAFPALAQPPSGHIGYDRRRSPRRWAQSLRRAAPAVDQWGLTCGNADHNKVEAVFSFQTNNLSNLQRSPKVRVAEPFNRVSKAGIAGFDASASEIYALGGSIQNRQENREGAGRTHLT